MSIESTLFKIALSFLFFGVIWAAPVSDKQSTDLAQGILSALTMAVAPEEVLLLLDSPQNAKVEERKEPPKKLVSLPRSPKLLGRSKVLPTTTSTTTTTTEPSQIEKDMAFLNAMDDEENSTNNIFNDEDFQTEDMSRGGAFNVMARDRCGGRCNVNQWCGNGTCRERRMTWGQWG